MTQLPAWQRLIQKFNMHGNILCTWDFATDPSLACEYRRLMCDLKRKGYDIRSEKVTSKSWTYHLIVADDKGQMNLTI